MNLRFLLLTMGVAGLWFGMLPITAIGSRIVLGVYGLTYLFGCGRTRRAVLFVLPTLYLPYLWLISAGWPSEWTGYRWYWIEIAWQLPGLPMEMAMHPLNAPWFDVVTVLTTLFVFFAAVMIARISLRFSILTGLVTLLLSMVSSTLAYIAFRA